MLQSTMAGNAWCQAYEADAERNAGAQLTFSGDKRQRKQLYTLRLKLMHLSVRIWKGLGRAALSLSHLTGNGMCVLLSGTMLLLSLCVYAHVSVHVHVCVYTLILKLTEASQ